MSGHWQQQYDTYDYHPDAPVEPAVSVGTAGSRALSHNPSAQAPPGRGASEGGPLTSWSKREQKNTLWGEDDGRSGSFVKHFTPPPKGTPPGSQLLGAPPSAGRPGRYQNPAASELGTPGGYATGLSSSFEDAEGEEGDDALGSSEPPPGAPAAGSVYGATPRQAEQRSPQRAVGWAPLGMDAASYAAGEKAAALAAFQRLLPSHQALGQLLAALEALASRMDRESEQWRQLQVAQVRTSSQVESALQRLDTLDFMRIPQLQQACDEAAACRAAGGGSSTGASELADALHGLQVVLAALSQQQAGERQQGDGAAHVGRCQQLLCLLRAAAGLAQRALSKADVAVLLLSRKILLAEPTDGYESSSSTDSRRWKLAQQGIAAALFVAAVEALWQAQLRLSKAPPVSGSQALRPLELVLRVARVAVWSAAGVLGAAALRQGCSTVADTGCQVLRAAALPPKLAAVLARLRAGLGRGAQPPAQDAGM